jgi:hypothetical protein
MGMTEELAIGHYFRRTTAIESLFGPVDYHLRRYERLANAPARAAARTRLAPTMNCLQLWTSEIRLHRLVNAHSGA